MTTCVTDYFLLGPVTWQQVDTPGNYWSWPRTSLVQKDDDVHIHVIAGAGQKK